MKRLTLLSLALSTGLVLACGPTTSTPDGGNDAGSPDGGAGDGGGMDAGTLLPCQEAPLVDVDGTVRIHPVTAAVDANATLDGASFRLEDPLKALQGKDAVLEYEDNGSCAKAIAPLTPDATDPSTAPFSFQQVSTKGVSLGLIGVLDDTMEGTDVFCDTASGLAGGPIADDLTGVSGYAVTQATEAHLAQVVFGGAAGDLNAAGWILGMFVDDAGNPMDGVALVDLQGNPAQGVLYPTADFMGAEQDGNTSANGVFIVTDVALGSFTGQKDGYTFTDQQAATSEGAVFVMFLVGTANN
ncbi:MAG: hypothetical protein D6729_10405 [Deltaproteobacteria bacterium]|nr:MAG: hypothetical protein D6729_10405 [Deltaproteobacteria bacterium]